MLKKGLKITSKSKKVLKGLEKVADVAKYIAFFPFGKNAKTLAALFLINQLLFPLAGNLFPSAEKYLENEGIDPEIVNSLTNANVRVHDSKITYKYYHLASQIPALIGIIAYKKSYNPDIEGSIAHSDKGIPYTLHDVFNHGHVRLPPKDLRADDFIQTMTGIPKSRIENLGLSDQEARMLASFHEFRHTDDDNGYGRFAEADSDYHTGIALAKAFNKPELEKLPLYLRAANAYAQSESFHQTALSVDAMMRGAPIPSDEEIHSAIEEIFGKLDQYKKHTSKRQPAAIKYAQSFRAMLNDPNANLSPLGKRRAELYIEAMEFFVPKAMGVEPKVTAPLSIQHNKPNNPAPGLTS